MTEKFGDWGSIAVAVFLEIMLTLQSVCESRTKAEQGVQKGSCNETLYCKALNVKTSGQGGQSYSLKLLANILCWLRKNNSKHFLEGLDYFFCYLSQELSLKQLLKKKCPCVN